jgi:hypothetical protein
MQLRDHTAQVLDPEGVEHADINSLRRDVLMAARSLIGADAASGLIDLRFRIDVEDEDGVIVYTLRFSEALQIIPEHVEHRAA